MPPIVGNLCKSLINRQGPSINFRVICDNLGRLPLAGSLGDSAPIVTSNEYRPLIFYFFLLQIIPEATMKRKF
jgi:hypothetical protein